MSLNSQTMKVAMTCHVPYGMDIAEATKKVEEFVAGHCVNWFWILHDSDEDKDGVIKPAHFHILFQSSDAKAHRLMYFLNRVAEVFGVEDLQPFSARIWKNYESDIQYLVHKNDKDKHQYEEGLVRAYDREELKKVLSLEVTPTLTIDRIVNVCRESESIVECYRTLGLGVAQMYRALIVDIFRAEHNIYGKR